MDCPINGIPAWEHPKQIGCSSYGAAVADTSSTTSTGNTSGSGSNSNNHPHRMDDILVTTPTTPQPASPSPRLAFLHLLPTRSHTNSSHNKKLTVLSASPCVATPTPLSFASPSKSDVTKQKVFLPPPSSPTKSPFIQHQHQLTQHTQPHVAVNHHRIPNTSMDHRNKLNMNGGVSPNKMMISFDCDSQSCCPSVGDITWDHTEAMAFQTTETITARKSRLSNQLPPQPQQQQHPWQNFQEIKSETLLSPTTTNTNTTTNSNSNRHLNPYTATSAVIPTPQPQLPRTKNRVLTTVTTTPTPPQQQKQKQQQATNASRGNQPLPTPLSVSNTITNNDTMVQKQRRRNSIHSTTSNIYTHNHRPEPKPRRRPPPPQQQQQQTSSNVSPKPPPMKDIPLRKLLSAHRRASLDHYSNTSSSTSSSSGSGNGRPPAAPTTLVSNTRNDPTEIQVNFSDHFVLESPSLMDDLESIYKQKHIHNSSRSMGSNGSCCTPQKTTVTQSPQQQLSKENYGVAVVSFRDQIRAAPIPKEHHWTGATGTYPGSTGVGSTSTATNKQRRNSIHNSICTVRVSNLTTGATTPSYDRRDSLSKGSTANNATNIERNHRQNQSLRAETTNPRTQHTSLSPVRDGTTNRIPMDAYLRMRPPQMDDSSFHRLNVSKSSLSTARSTKSATSHRSSSYSTSQQLEESIQNLEATLQTIAPNDIRYNEKECDNDQLVDLALESSFNDIYLRPSSSITSGSSTTGSESNKRTVHQSFHHQESSSALSTSMMSSSMFSTLSMNSNNSMLLHHHRQQQRPPPAVMIVEDFNTIIPRNLLITTDHTNDNDVDDCVDMGTAMAMTSAIMGHHD